MKVLNVLSDIVEGANELAYIGALGLKQPPAYIHIMGGGGGGVAKFVTGGGLQRTEMVL